jgi:hypothetical protein
MTATLDVFAEFQTDHRKIRDMLFDLKNQIEQKNVQAAREVLGKLNVFVGPHFRYEEEGLYPALRPLLEDYVDKLYVDHDGAIENARGLAKLLQKDTLTDADVQAGRKGVLAILPHVSDCQGLSVFMESIQQVRPQVINVIARKIEACRQEGAPLLQWVDTIRRR